MTRRLDIPVFDADHHLYETRECFTRHLPAELSSVFRYVQVNGRTKVVVRNTLSVYIPNPTFEVVAKPGSTSELADRTDAEVRRIMGLNTYELLGVAVPGAAEAKGSTDS